MLLLLNGLVCALIHELEYHFFTTRHVSIYTLLLAALLAYITWQLIGLVLAPAWVERRGWLRPRPQHLVVTLTLVALSAMWVATGMHRSFDVPRDFHGDVTGQATYTYSESARLLFFAMHFCGELAVVGAIAAIIRRRWRALALSLATAVLVALWLAGWFLLKPAGPYYG